MTKLTDRTFTDLLAAFRSPDPTPGGGSASALAGAVGAALLAMVAGIPKPRAEPGDDVARLRAAGDACAQFAEQLRVLIDRDSEAYDRVMSAYRLPKGSDEEKTARSATIQQALRYATDTPLDVMRASRGAIDHGDIIARLGNQNASSDVGVALELLMAALRGAKYNVEINLQSIKDEPYAAQVRSESETLLTFRTKN